MKKIVSLIVVLVAFSFNANAQSKSLSAQNEVSVQENSKESAYNVISELNSVVSLDESLKNDFMSLIMMRNDAVASASTKEEKKAIFDRYTTKMLSALKPEQIEKLKMKEELYKKLAVFSSEK